MTITINNKNDPAYQSMFDALIQEVFGFSFQPWFEYKLWDDNYESYSIVEDGRMLSNICIYKSDLLIRGQKFPAIQFGAVATAKNARGRGLSRMLMEHVLSLYPNRPAYLAANGGVVDFYPKFGFRQVQTYRAMLALPSLRPIPSLRAQRSNPEKVQHLDCYGKNTIGMTENATKLHINDELVTHALQTRGTFSNLVDCTNTRSIQMFHLIMQYYDSIYHIPHLNALVIAQQTDSKLFLADVISKNPIILDQVLAALPFTGYDTIEFGFCPDWLGVTPNWTPTDPVRDPFFIRGNWNLPEKFRFPATSET